MLQQLLDQFSKAHADAEAIRKKYEGDPKAVMSSDDEQAWRKALDDADATGVKIELYQKDLEAQKTRQRLEEWATNPELPTGMKGGPAGGATTKYKKPDGTFYTEDECKTQMSAWSKYLLHGDKGLQMMDEAERKTLQLTNPTAAGFLAAPPQWINELIVAIKDQTVMRGLSRNIELADASSCGAPTLTSDVADADWIGENEAVTFTDLNVGKRELFPHFVAKGCKISRPLLMKNIMDPYSLAMDRLAYKFGITEEKAFMTGNGNKKPLGVFTADAAGISTSRDFQGATSLVISPDDIIDMFHYLKSGYANRSTWLFHRNALNDIRKLKDSQGFYLWQPFEFPGQQLVGSNPGLIMGRPYVVSEYAPSKTAGAWVAGNYPVLFGDFSYYWIATAMQMEMQTLTEMYALTNEIAYIGRMWVDAMPVLEEAFVRFKVKA